MVDSEYDEDWEWTTVLPYQTLNPTLLVPSVLLGESNLLAVESSRNPTVRLRR